MKILLASSVSDLPVYAASDDCALKIVDDNDPVILGKGFIVAKDGKILKEEK